MPTFLQTVFSHGLLGSQSSLWIDLGVFAIRIRVRNVRGGSTRSITALVDTGSTLPWIPRQIAEKLKVRESDYSDFETAGE